MFNNINDSNIGSFYSSQLERQNNIVQLALMRANSQKASSAEDGSYVDKSEISNSAIELFLKDCDISKFNKIAMSDSENLSHIEMVKELFKQGVVDVYEDDVFSELVTNSKLWDDLEA